MEKDREKPEYNNINSKIYFKIKNKKKNKKHAFSKFYLGKNSNMNKALENDFIFDSMGSHE